jgi:uncharacterized membrane protein
MSRGVNVAAFSRVVAAVSGVFFLAFGVWAMAARESFHAGVAEFEPYNQHLVQDIGAFQIGLGAVLLLAVAGTAAALPVALLGVGVGSAAHVVSHVVGRDLGGTPETDIPVFALVAVLLLTAGFVSWRASRPR